MDFSQCPCSSFVKKEEKKKKQKKGISICFCCTVLTLASYQSLGENVFPPHVMLGFPAWRPALMEVGPKGSSTRDTPAETRLRKAPDSLHLPPPPSWRVSVSSCGGLTFTSLVGAGWGSDVAFPDTGGVIAMSHSQHICSDSTFQ